MAGISEEINERITRVRKRIAEAAERSGREPGGIALIAVTKTVEADRILVACHEGLLDFGENRVQEALRKIPGLKSKGCTARWHLIGHLQSNKALRAVELFDMIQSVDSLALAERLNRVANESGKRLGAMLELNVGGEEAKSGFNPAELMEALHPLAGLEHLDFRGLMAIPPFLEDPERVRPYFRQVREMLMEINRRQEFAQPLTELSMGMSHDFDIAIEEGATLVRVGTAIFGPRPETN